MDGSLVTALGLGLLLGLRHALDADHVAAVSTLVSRERGLVRSCLLGAFWGAGHTLALLGAGVAVIAFKLTITPGSSRRRSSGRSAWSSSSWAATCSFAPSAGSSSTGTSTRTTAWPTATPTCTSGHRTRRMSI